MVGIYLISCDCSKKKNVTIIFIFYRSVSGGPQRGWVSVAVSTAHVEKGSADVPCHLETPA